MRVVSITVLARDQAITLPDRLNEVVIRRAHIVTAGPLPPMFIFERRVSPPVPGETTIVMYRKFISKIQPPRRNSPYATDLNS